MMNRDAQLGRTHRRFTSAKIIASGSIVAMSLAYGSPIALAAAPVGQPAVNADPLVTGYLAAPAVFRAAVEKVMPSVVRIETYGSINPAPPPPAPRGNRRGAPAPAPGPGGRGVPGTNPAEPEPGPRGEGFPIPGFPDIPFPIPGLDPVPAVPDTQPDGIGGRGPAPAPGAAPGGGGGGRGARGGQRGRGAPQPAAAGVTGISRPGEGPTTGLIVTADGYIITSTYNFILNPPIIIAIFSDGSQHVAKLLGRDETRGLCLLKVEGVTNLPVPRFADPQRMRVGQWAISVGVGFGGDDPVISAGIISAKSRISSKAIQTDANISPANYGGPLIDIDGRVVGVCTPMTPGGEGPGAGVDWYDSGIGFAVPMDDPGPWLQKLKDGKVIQPGKIGIVTPRPATDDDGDPIAEVGEGVGVDQVVPDGPAAKAGLVKGDRVLAIDGQRIIDLMELRVIMGRYAAGDEVALRILHEGDEKTLIVTLIAGADLVPLDQTPTMPGAPPPGRGGQGRGRGAPAP